MRSRKEITLNDFGIKNKMSDFDKDILFRYYYDFLRYNQNYYFGYKKQDFNKNPYKKKLDVISFLTNKDVYSEKASETAYQFSLELNKNNLVENMQSLYNIIDLSNTSNFVELRKNYLKWILDNITPRDINNVYN